ncbi:4'-phosphopantetheinyl transferase superfamily protein [Streptomyces iconiensis]|uniref:4'-phosphopantetheinyl transferase superfamily protein n=1 Tax=Streptomyces iconiensis TaxID=1384038 RepID=A0ABT7A6T1_9ACTN|nr:4'-phosphopantetheinyl transferase superfamily protein [Streptomyces iconiensis]MDJ1136541.1 4'-phosphopantetheinyl transferase superfamily protein [Streptomyces iconiensis]
MYRSHDTLITVLARSTNIAVGAHPVPSRVTDDILLPFSQEERDFIDTVSLRCRARWVARLWARKEAALRLDGPGSLGLAAETNTLLGGALDGTVTLPPAPSGLNGVSTAYVHDIASHPEPIAAAVDTHISTVYAWYPNRTGTVHHIPSHN